MSETGNTTCTCGTPIL